MTRLDLNHLINFYDHKRPSKKGDASELKKGDASALNMMLGEELALALIKDFFSRSKSPCNVLDSPCTQGTPKGNRLDAWIRVKSTEGEHHYQREIKNWSAHSVGGKEAPSNTSESELETFRIGRWANVFSITDKTLKEASARKVLTRMRPEDGSWKVRPLIIFWDTMHPDGKKESFFKVDVHDPNFDQLWVFSMSTYVRSLQKNNVNHIDVEMPDTLRRLSLISSILG